MRPPLRKNLLRKSFFTLAEILIVCILLVAMIGVVGINIRSWVQEQRFQTEVGLILEDLRLAQDLMLIVDASVSVELQKEQEGISCKIVGKGIFSPQWQQVLERSRRKLRTIQEISFDDGSGDRSLVSGQILVLRFLSGGGSMSRGILHLAESSRNSAESFNRYITLMGYPQPITSSATPVPLSRENASFDQKLTEATMEEVRTK